MAPILEDSKRDPYTMPTVSFSTTVYVRVCSQKTADETPNKWGRATQRHDLLPTGVFHEAGTGLNATLGATPSRGESVIRWDIVKAGVDVSRPLHVEGCGKRGDEIIKTQG